MKLTKEQAIEEHRKMWNWIADETKKQKSCISKKEYLHLFHPRLSVLNNCFLCDYVRNIQSDYAGDYYIDCDKCPLSWDSCDCYTSGETYYSCWNNACLEDDWELAATWARIIANLKEK